MSAITLPEADIRAHHMFLRRELRTYGSKPPEPHLRSYLGGAARSGVSAPEKDKTA